MVAFYQVKWLDVDGRPAGNKFFAAQASDAIAICEDLVDICAASWRELKEDGQVLTVSSSKYQQPASTAARVECFAVLEMSSGGPRSEHTLKLHCVLPSFLSRDKKTTFDNPFRNVGLLRTAEGVQFTEFLKGSYQFKRKSNNRY